MSSSKVFRAIEIAFAVPVFVAAVITVVFGLNLFWKSIVELPLMMAAANDGNYARSGAHGVGLWAGPIVMFIGTRLWKFARRAAAKAGPPGRGKKNDVTGSGDSPDTSISGGSNESELS